MAELSKRMEALVEWIDGTTAADIGCDHAYVICEAVKRGKCQKGYACDIAEGPLQRAKETIKNMELENQVTPRLQSGMTPLMENLDFAVIAGLGGFTTMEILEDWLQASKGTLPVHLLLSPHSDAPKLRKWLQDHHFQIERERRILDEERWYPILDVQYPGLMELNEAELLYGKNPVWDEEWKDYLESETKKWERIKANAPANAHQKMDHHLKLLHTLKEQAVQ